MPFSGWMPKKPLFEADGSDIRGDGEVAEWPKALPC